MCGGDKRRFKQMITFLLAYLGSPMICYGDEVGLEGDFAESARQSFRWENGDSELQDFYRRFIAFRRGSQALRFGSVETILTDEAQRAYAFVREYEGETVYVVFNASDSPASVNLAVGAEGTWSDALGQHEAVTSNGTHLHIELEARGVAVLTRI
jgi:glycosidase